MRYAYVIRVRDNKTRLSSQVRAAVLMLFYFFFLIVACLSAHTVGVVNWCV
jgi:hypothetical protein